jgi:thiol-disulfide isomerase/thioredoxin
MRMRELCRNHTRPHTVNHAFVLGPLALPYALLLLLAAVVSSLLIGTRIGRARGVDVEPALWKALLVGLVAARLAFIWEFRSAYLAAPLTVVDIRDGGWNATAGFIAAWLYVLSLYRRRPELRKAMQAALLTGSFVWLAGAIALALVLPGPARTPLPALAFASLDNPEPLPLARFKGKPTVVNLWATWCPPCVREMPVLQQAQRDRPDVHFVFLNQGESAARVGAWLQARNLGLHNVLLDETRSASAAFQQSALPTTLFFDADGLLVTLRIGELSAATLAERLAATRR